MKKFNFNIIILNTLFLCTIFTSYKLNAQTYTPCNPTHNCAGDNKKITNKRLDFSKPDAPCDGFLFYDEIECDNIKYANRLEWYIYTADCQLTEQDKQNILANNQINYLMAGEELSIQQACMKEIVVRADNPNDPCWYNSGENIDANHRDCGAIDPLTGIATRTGHFGIYVSCNASICCNYQFDEYPDAHGNPMIGVVNVTTSGPCVDDGRYRIGGRFSKQIGNCLLEGTITSSSSCEAACVLGDRSRGWKMANALKKPTLSNNKNYEFIIKGKTIELNNTNQNIKALFVYDLNGKIVFSETKNFDQTIELNNVKQNQIYLVKVLLNNNAILKAKMYVE